MRYLALVLAVAVASSVGAQPSWERVADHTDVRTLLVLPDGAVLAGTRTDGLRSADGVAPFDTLTFVADRTRAVDDHERLYGPDGPIREGVYQFARHSSGALVAATETGGFRSTDGGASWAEAVSRPSPRSCIPVVIAYTAAVEAADGDLILTGTSSEPSPACKLRQIAYRSADGGLTWKGSSFSYGGGLGGGFAEPLVALEDGVVVTASSRSIYRRSPDGVIPTEIPGSVRAVVAVGGALYAGSYSYSDDPAAGGVLRSDDRGRTWTPDVDGLGGLSVTALAVAGDGTVLAGTHTDGVYARASDGRWSRVSAGLGGGGDAYGTGYAGGEPDGVDDALQVTALAVGLDGRAWVATRGGLFRTAAQVVAREDEPEAAALTVSVWPNPAASAVTVALAGRAGEGTVRVEAFDSLGRRVAVVHDGPLSARLSVDVSGWPAGVYVVRAVSAGGAASARLVVGR